MSPMRATCLANHMFLGFITLITFGKSCQLYITDSVLICYSASDTSAQTYNWSRVYVSENFADFSSACFQALWLNRETKRKKGWWYLCVYPSTTTWRRIAGVEV